MKKTFICALLLSIPIVLMPVTKKYENRGKKIEQLVKQLEKQKKENRILTNKLQTEQNKKKQLEEKHYSEKQKFYTNILSLTLKARKEKSEKENMSQLLDNQKLETTKYKQESEKQKKLKRIYTKQLEKDFLDKLSIANMLTQKLKIELAQKDKLLQNYEELTQKNKNKMHEYKDKIEYYQNKMIKHKIYKKKAKIHICQALENAIKKHTPAERSAVSAVFYKGARTEKEKSVKTLQELKNKIKQELHGKKALYNTCNF